MASARKAPVDDRPAVSAGSAFAEIAAILLDMIQSRDKAYGATPQPDRLTVSDEVLGAEIVVPLTCAALEQQMEEMAQRQLQQASQARLLSSGRSSRSMQSGQSSGKRLNNF